MLMRSYFAPKDMHASTVPACKISVHCMVIRKFWRFTALENIPILKNHLFFYTSCMVFFTPRVWVELQFVFIYIHTPSLHTHPLTPNALN